MKYLAPGKTVFLAVPIKPVNKQFATLWATTWLLVVMQRGQCAEQLDAVAILRALILNARGHTTLGVPFLHQCL